MNTINEQLISLLKDVMRHMEKTTVALSIANGRKRTLKQLRAKNELPYVYYNVQAAIVSLKRHPVVESNLDSAKLIEEIRNIERLSWRKP